MRNENRYHPFPGRVYIAGTLQEQWKMGTHRKTGELRSICRTGTNERQSKGTHIGQSEVYDITKRRDGRHLRWIRFIGERPGEVNRRGPVDLPHNRILLPRIAQGQPGELELGRFEVIEKRFAVFYVRAVYFDVQQLEVGKVKRFEYRYGVTVGDEMKSLQAQQRRRWSRQLEERPVSKGADIDRFRAAAERNEAHSVLFDKRACDGSVRNPMERKVLERVFVTIRVR